MLARVGSLGVLAAALLASQAIAQVRHPGRPFAESALPPDVPLIVLPAPAGLARGAGAPADDWGPYRYGREIPVALSPDTDGRWDQVPGGQGIVWRLEIASPGAFSLGVLFDEFDLPESARLFLYDPDRRAVLGAYTHENERPNGMFAVQPVPGDRVVIEYVQDSLADEPPRLRIGRIIHDDRDVLRLLSDQGSVEATCFIDVNCPLGAPYQDVKRSVVMVLAGIYICSAGLLNNTAEDGTPYLYTAQHCGDMTNVIAFFNYEAVCGGTVGFPPETVFGATPIASSSKWDSQLNRLSAIPASYEPFFAGWSRTRRPRGPTIGISHPLALPKKLSIDWGDPRLSGGGGSLDGQGGGGASVFLQVSLDRGRVHFGSSGSPLFTSTERVVGTASAGPIPRDCGMRSLLYGRFHGFWSSYLARFLDPLGLDAQGIDGYDPFHPQAFPYRGSGVNPDVFMSTSPPALGSSWTSEIDASGDPDALLTVIVGAATPTSEVVRWGELLVDLRSGLHFLDLAPVFGGIAKHSIAIPPDPALANTLSFVQAVILGGQAQLTNAIKLRVNNP